MFTNKTGYNSIVKYIPYDNIEIIENNNEFTFWNKYKVDVMRKFDGEFIHVDSDVFLFEDLFKAYITDNKYDLIVQDIIPRKGNFVIGFVNDNENILTKEKILDRKKYDGRCISCGVFGMRNNYKKSYFEAIDTMYYRLKNNKFKNIITVSMVLEELTAYMIANKYDFNIYDVLPHDLILKYGVQNVGNQKNYTHMWFNSKFSERNIKLIKKKIKKEFPEQYHLVEKFDLEVFNKKENKLELV